MPESATAGVSKCDHFEVCGKTDGNQKRVEVDDVPKQRVRLEFVNLALDCALFGFNKIS